METLQEPINGRMRFNSCKDLWALRTNRTELAESKIFKVSFTVEASESTIKPGVSIQFQGLSNYSSHFKVGSLGEGNESLRPKKAEIMVLLPTLSSPKTTTF